MKRTLCVLVLVLALLVCGLQITAAAETETPKVILMKGFWFADGYLADDPRFMDWQVIPEQSVRLYESPSLTTPIVGELVAGVPVRIQDVAFEAYLGLQQLRAVVPGSSKDGRVRIEPGDIIRLVCYMGDAMAAYIGDELVLVDLYELKLEDQVRPEWQARLYGANQWLQLWTPDGKAGWARFYADGQNTSRGRWRIQPRAAGGRSNFNTIVFSPEQPRFQGQPR